MKLQAAAARAVALAADFGPSRRTARRTLGPGEVPRRAGRVQIATQQQQVIKNVSRVQGRHNRLQTSPAGTSVPSRAKWKSQPAPQTSTQVQVRTPRGAQRTDSRSRWRS